MDIYWTPITTKKRLTVESRKKQIQNNKNFKISRHNKQISIQNLKQKINYKNIIEIRKQNVSIKRKICKVLQYCQRQVRKQNTKTKWKENFQEIISYHETVIRN